ncbi:type VII secretion protein EccB [Streptomyces sulfonofaciens]|uniref:Type VII secretion protein EccB n=1 Tax=Streptomyces sulfonofaciens TaxID=68272 RepID=A0A919GNU7_9ACTN|nr:type VII secretion protein EccB [Streptomyces sulfonofaciens]GHH88037.1 type VII secretion protein EccB [Streptomyces sulfonofaciens]
MASRRDELNAYTFAKRRMLAAFVQPSATGSEESAPRPLRALVPSAVVAVVILAGFGAWGMLKPTAPQGWDTPGEKVIIASKSTTRYVVLETDHKVQLHPVLNMASAKLLLDADKGQVINVDESVLDSGRLPHGATIGIPYAPDRLPDPDEAAAAKRWAVCQRPGEGGAVQKAAFVFAQREEKRMEGGQRLHGGELLYVQGPAPDRTRYVVDPSGTAYPLDDNQNLLGAVVSGARRPQQVSKEWLNTLHPGDRIVFPEISGAGGAAGVHGTLDPAADRVGMVLQALDGGVMRYYVVLPGRVAPISDFMANLLLQDPDLSHLMTTGEALRVNRGSFTPSPTEFGDDHAWPQDKPQVVNTPSTHGGARNTVCNVLRSVAGNGTTTLSTWAGTSFPAALATGSSSAYVTPGSGQLFRQFQGTETKVGGVFLVTDTGLRYALQSNGDSATDDSGIGESGKKGRQQQPEEKDSQTRLGYGDVTPAPVPAPWSEFLPTGPRLSKAAASQPQGS